MFLKVLYEDDINAKEKLERKKLSCAEDFDFLVEVNKATVALWDVILYWRKKRHICYTKPFLDLDLNLILKSIARVNKYLDSKLPENEFVSYKAQPITKAVN